MLPPCTTDYKLSQWAIHSYILKQALLFLELNKSGHLTFIRQAPGSTFYETRWLKRKSPLAGYCTLFKVHGSLLCPSPLAFCSSLYMSKWKYTLFSCTIYGKKYLLYKQNLSKTLFCQFTEHLHAWQFLGKSESFTAYHKCFSTRRIVTVWLPSVSLGKFSSQRTREQKGHYGHFALWSQYIF